MPQIQCNMKKSVLSFIFIISISSGIFSQPFSTQSQWEKYFTDRIQNLDPIEGIWSVSYTGKRYDSYNRLVWQEHFPPSEKMAIYKTGNVYMRYNIGGINDYSNFSFQNSATSGIYILEIYFNASRSITTANVVLAGNGLLEFSYQEPTAQVRINFARFGQQYVTGTKMVFEHNWIKLFPKAEDYNKPQKSSGTGFAISSNGIIVTNYHVIDGANSIIVRGINSDFYKTYKAKVLASDRNNDLALIQIDDYGFTSLGTIPYTIRTGATGVGENIFVLGYPLRATMGDEIKLTNGIISSRSGFQGDVTSYQISAPVQPGNSGGPLFDNQGNIIGIINAKHIGAENASYAVKTSYLTNLIDLLQNPPRLQTVNSLSEKSLTQQVELAKRFVYIIETE